MEPTVVNSDKKNPTAAIVGGIVVLIVGLAIGFGVAKATNKDDSSTTSTKSSSSSMAMDESTGSKASDLRANLVTLGVEHMILTDQAIDGALDGSPNASQSAAALYTNGTNIGAAVGSVYGKDAETTFNTVWKLHLDQFVAYAVAGSKGDKAGQTAALSNIDTNYTKPLAQYLAKANPNLPEATLESALREHVNMTAKVIDLHIAKDYTGEQTELAQANTHIEGLFSTLAAGIVKQYPAKFQN